MEHSCQRCNSAVNDSSAFCPNCGAPQVRFSDRESSSIPIAVVSDNAPTTTSVGPSHSFHHPATASNSRAALRAALNAGVVGAILSSIPVGPSFILAMPLAGFLCVLLYRRYRATGEPTPAAGFRLGAGAGLAGFAILILLTAITTVGFHEENQLRNILVQYIRQAQSRYTDPQAQPMFQYLQTPEGMVFLMVFYAIFTCLMFVLLSGLGGAVSAALLRRKDPPA